MKRREAEVFEAVVKINNSIFMERLLDGSLKITWSSSIPTEVLSPSLAQEVLDRMHILLPPGDLMMYPRG